jgi:hypothetical protein
MWFPVYTQDPVKWFPIQIYRIIIGGDGCYDNIFLNLSNLVSGLYNLLYIV